jgi:hypothetical protein
MRRVATAGKRPFHIFFSPWSTNRINIGATFAMRCVILVKKSTWIIHGSRTNTGRINLHGSLLIPGRHGRVETREHVAVEWFRLPAGKSSGSKLELEQLFELSASRDAPYPETNFLQSNVDATTIDGVVLLEHSYSCSFRLQFAVDFERCRQNSFVGFDPRQNFAHVICSRVVTENEK